jgi:type II secretory pathway pseudopilin PulG
MLRRRWRGGQPGGARGAAYLAVMIGIAVISAVLASTAQVFSNAQQRDRERHLLWVGDQYRRALLSYARLPLGVETYPKELADLLEDRRRGPLQRHLRRLYYDPLTGSADWEVIRNAQQRIIGVHSRSTRKPIKRHGFPAHYAAFEKAETYADWQFVIGTAVPGDAAPAPVTPSATAGDRPLLRPSPATAATPASPAGERRPAAR